MKKSRLILYWSARLLAAAIMVQTLYFKFSGASESVYIFSTVGMEPWGRIGIGVLELIASILLLTNKAAWTGAALALGLMVGAIGLHITKLGIEVQGDGGYLFFLAVIVSLCSILVLFMNRNTIMNTLSRLR